MQKSDSDEMEVQSNTQTRALSAAFGGEQVPFNMFVRKGNNERVARPHVSTSCRRKFDAATGKEQLTVVGIPDPFPGPISPIATFPPVLELRRVLSLHSKLPTL